MSLRIIAGKFKGRLLKAPKGSSTRPTQGMLREAFFNICQYAIENSRFLDLFAGSGAMGFEALSRGAAYSVFIEKERGAAQCIRENIAALGIEAQSALYPLDYRAALKNLNKTAKPFDIIYIDPPYNQPLAPILETLLSHQLTTEKTLIFAEQRYTQKPAPPPDGLICVDSRKFGEALLQQYRI